MGRAAVVLFGCAIVVSCTKRGEKPVDVTRDPAPEVSASAKPPADPNASRVVTVALGHYRACAARVDGRVVCWGKWLMGDPQVPAAPTLVDGVTDVVQLHGFDTDWCGLQRKGTIVCWHAQSPKTTSIDVEGAVELASDCARLPNGKVVCWETD